MNDDAQPPGGPGPINAADASSPEPGSAVLRHFCPSCGRQHAVILPREPGHGEECLYVCPETIRLEMFRPGEESRYSSGAPRGQDVRGGVLRGAPREA